MSKYIFRLCIASLPYTGFITLAGLATDNYTWYWALSFIMFGFAACFISMYLKNE